MSDAQMRAAIKKAYSGPLWSAKIDKMPERQVAAIYLRLLNKNNSER